MIHRGLNLESILFKNDEVKISDFGISRYIDRAMSVTKTGALGYQVI